MIARLWKEFKDFMHEIFGAPAVYPTATAEEIAAIASPKRKKKLDKKKCPRRNPRKAERKRSDYEARTL